jgi:hypothetical protein
VHSYPDLPNRRREYSPTIRHPGTIVKECPFGILMQ